MGASASRIGGVLTPGQANTGLKNANTATLRSALTNYIEATKNMNENKIRAALNNKKNGINISYKNRIANGVAKAVIEARRANGTLAAVNAGIVSESAAATQVNKSANAINVMKNAANSANLNSIISKIYNNANLSPNAALNNRAKAYIAIRRNKLNKNKVVNAKGKYKNLFSAVNGVSAAQNLKNVLNLTSNQKLQANIKTQNNAKALFNRVKNSAKRANINIKNKNINAALTRIVNHQSRLPSSRGEGLAESLKNNFKPANSNINANNKKVGYKLIENTNGNYMKVKRNSNNSTNWSRANNKVYTKKNGGGFNVKTTNNLSSHPINNNNLT